MGNWKIVNTGALYDPFHIAYNSSNCFFELTMSKKQPEVLFSKYMVMGKEEKHLEFPFLIVFPLPSFAAYFKFI